MAHLSSSTNCSCSEVSTLCELKYFFTSTLTSSS
uniref:Uncharacterized protein n=1 Tax=Rhizophora mucronata TaxID=61149 RepID=A0A2P2Q5Z3_RHIMU